MRNSKNSFNRIMFAVLFGITVFFTACSDDSLVSPSFEQEFNTSELPPASITIEPYWEGNVLVFRLRNNSRDTIVNDFHVQFDSTVKIIGWITMPGWQIDPATTDTAKGKIGVKKGPQGQPIPPMGGVGIPIGVQIKFTGLTKKNPRQWWDYTWQATRDGIVVRSGQGAFPAR
jgi:hypothetical protein